MWKDLLVDDTVRCLLGAGGWGDPPELEVCQFELWAEGSPAQTMVLRLRNLYNIDT